MIWRCSKPGCSRATSFTVALLGAFFGLAHSGEATCLLTRGQPIKPGILKAYEKDPKALLIANPRGGVSMSLAVAQLSLLGPHAVGQIFSVAASGSLEQQDAIGKGLRLAADACQGQGAEDALKAINSGIASTGIARVSRAFDSVDDARVKPVAEKKPAPGIADELNDKITSIPDISDVFAPLPDPFGPPRAWR